MIIRTINTVFMRHSRWLFGIFTIIIIVSFLGFLTPGQFGVGGCNEPGNMRVGTIFGKDVTYNELSNMQRSIAIYYRLAMNMDPKIEPQQAFGALAMVHAAKQRGISVSDAEIAESLQNMAAFRGADGKFSYPVYQQVLENIRKQGIDGDMVAECFRNMAMVRKLSEELMESVVVTPGEAENFFRNANEKYEVKVAEFRREEFSKNVKVDPAELMNFFKENRNRYLMPAQYTATIAEFSLTDPELLKAAAGVSDADVKAYFEANKPSFAKDGKVPAFDSVKADARKHLVADRIRKAAYAKAQDFARAAYDKVGEAADKKAAFKELAGKNIRTFDTVKFAADAEVIGNLAEPELVKQFSMVFESVPVTNAVAGKSAVYVGLLTAREVERPAEFNEVSRKVQDDFIRDKAVILAREAATAAEKTLKVATAGKPWDQTLTFSMVNPPMTPTGMLVMMSATSLKAGEISKVVTTPDGAMIVGMVKRIPADSAEFAKNRAQWEMIWRQTKSRIQSSDFENYLQSQCVYELEREK